MPVNSSINTKTDAELLTLLRSGSRSGFSEIYQLYAPELINFAASRLSSLEEARDIIHDIFTALWDKRKLLVINGSIRSYLFSAVRYRIIDQVRRNITRKEYAAMVHSLGEAILTDTEELVHAKKVQMEVDAAVDALPPKTRLVYRLSRQHHLAIKEIAGELGVSEQTVKNQLSVALHKLRMVCNKLVSVLPLL